MKNAKSLVPVIILLMIVSLACSSLKSTSTATSPETAVDRAAVENEDQVVLKEISAAELDCSKARAAIDHLIALEQKRRSANLTSVADYDEKLARLKKIAEECRGGPGAVNSHYRVVGVSNNVSFTGEICSLERPFKIDAKYPGGTATTSFAPGSAAGGTTTVSGSGSGCTHSGEGTYQLTPNENGSAALTWKTTDTIACPGFSNSKTGSFSLTLQPAPDLSCP